ncbi:unnamed protein product [Larinioides sclopetarius]|uniref:DUF19 domain-containing protein n=2 Tax=Larinioides sclopetarius TaxID=280406 RepID=A0AAV1ZBK4_9ARAC
MIISFIFQLALLPGIITEDKCTLHQLQNCLESLQSVTQGSDLMLATTKQDLEAVCRTLKESIWCVDDHMKNCFTAMQKKVFNHVVQGARQFLLELCLPGSIQETYLIHSPCYKNVSLSETKCGPKYRHLIHLSEKVEQKDVDDSLRESCCAFNDLVQCKHLHVRQDCGQEASYFLQQHLDRISNSLIHEHCEHYMYDINSCAKSSVAKYFSQLTYLTISLVWFTSISF